MKFFHTLILVAGLIGAAACTSINTSSSFDSTASFDSYRTFGIDSKSSLPPLLNREIEQALQNELTQRGLKPAKSADLLVNYFTLVEDGVRVTETPTNIYVPHRRGYTVWTAYNTEIQEITEGTLFVDIVDARTKKLVWEGSAHGIVSRGDLERNKAKISKAINNMLAELPISEQD